jgi:hypothetical protein
VVSFTPLPLYPLYPLDKRLGGPQNRCGGCGIEKNLALPGIDPGPSSRSPSLYRLPPGYVFAKGKTVLPRTYWSTGYHSCKANQNREVVREHPTTAALDLAPPSAPQPAPFMMSIYTMIPRLRFTVRPETVTGFVYLGTQLRGEGGATRQLSRHLISCKSVPLVRIAASLINKVLRISHAAPHTERRGTFSFETSSEILPLTLLFS